MNDWYSLGATVATVVDGVVRYTSRGIPITGTYKRDSHIYVLKDGFFHCEDGPALYKYEDGMISRHYWMLFGKTFSFENYKIEAGISDGEEIMMRLKYGF